MHKTLFVERLELRHTPRKFPLTLDLVPGRILRLYLFQGLLGLLRRSENFEKTALFFLVHWMSHDLTR